MKAIQVGSDEVLQWRETETPVASAGEVLIKVHATAINRADLMQRRGFYPAPPGASTKFSARPVPKRLAIAPGLQDKSCEKLAALTIALTTGSGAVTSITTFLVEETSAEFVAVKVTV